MHQTGPHLCGIFNNKTLPPQPDVGTIPALSGKSATGQTVTHRRSRETLSNASPTSPATGRGHHPGALGKTRNRTNSTHRRSRETFSNASPSHKENYHTHIFFGKKMRPDRTPCQITRPPQPDVGTIPALSGKPATGRTVPTGTLGKRSVMHHHPTKESRLLNRRAQHPGALGKTRNRTNITHTPAFFGNTITFAEKDLNMSRRGHSWTSYNLHMSQSNILPSPIYRNSLVHYPKVHWLGMTCHNCLTCKWNTARLLHNTRPSPNLHMTRPPS